jgi:glycosyltransferase involved in cell wall biosynthesis
MSLVQPWKGANLTLAPPLSVVMPVHNAMPHLDQAIESILCQTFSDFEFVILDDASTDGSSKRLDEWASNDPRIRLLRVQKNLGPAISSERVAREARAHIVARMDADDIAYPTRLEEQLKVLEIHPDVGVVGGLWEIIDAKGRRIREPEPWRIIRHSVFPPFGNGPMMYRREVFERAGGYRPECEFWEDADLVIRMAAISKIMVIPHAIYQVRLSTTSTRIVSDQERLERGVDLMYRSSDRLRRHEAYDDIVQAKRSPNLKLDPRVFISLGSINLWTGGKPRLFRRLLQRGNLSLDFRSFSALVWTAWASLNPATLRSFMRLLLVARNTFATKKIRSNEPAVWTPRLGAAERTPPN